MFMFAKNSAFVVGLDQLAIHRNKRKNPEHVPPPIPSRFYYILGASIMETISFVSIASIFQLSDPPDPGIPVIYYGKTFLAFIPISFATELVFDFFHYWSHRLAHTFSSLYAIHRKHHSIHSLSGVITFYQDPLDYLFTNYIPMICSMTIVKYIFQIEYTMLIYSFIVMYKEFVEIAGHVDILESHSFSFPQFIWLPLLFGIELTQQVHHDHHLYLTCNFSKRFSLWDKVFGTYK